ncbi:hypothetical protein [Sphingomonas sp.]|uniref:hypothetical protein n=1 Tax=Sphingomonas sp. TaxID=28214 RepID=UPI003D6CCA66
MTAAEQFEILAAGLIGEPISHMWRGHGSAVFIEIGELSPWTKNDGSPGDPEGRVLLGVEWSWRIQDEKSIRCGSWSDETLWEPGFDQLRGISIRDCTLFGALPEIQLTTQTGVSFMSFSTTDGQPQWRIVDRRGERNRWFTVRDGQLHVGDGSEPAHR